MQSSVIAPGSPRPSAARLPEVNLPVEVVEAVSEGRFHVHAVDHVDQALALMTGRPAAEVMQRAEQGLDKLPH